MQATAASSRNIQSRYSTHPPKQPYTTPYQRVHHHSKNRLIEPSKVERYGVRIKGGKWINVDGFPILTSPHERYMYVMNSEGNLYFLEPSSSNWRVSERQSHASLGFQRIAAAGEIYVEHTSNKLVITNNSPDYWVDENSLGQMLERLQSAGFTMQNINVLTYGHSLTGAEALKRIADHAEIMTKPINKNNWLSGVTTVEEAFRPHNVGDEDWVHFSDSTNEGKISANGVLPGSWAKWGDAKRMTVVDLRKNIKEGSVSQKSDLSLMATAHHNSAINTLEIGYCKNGPCFSVEGISSDAISPSEILIIP